MDSTVNGVEGTAKLWVKEGESLENLIQIL